MSIASEVVPARNELLERFATTRRRTEALTRTLTPEDMVVQTMPDVSPTKWHLAHTTWFFEALVLERAVDGYAPFDACFHALFNSYYQSLGDPFPREERGLLSRPTVERVRSYRRHVDEALRALLEGGDAETVERVIPVIELGLQHEEQHQELLLMDIKHVLARNPLRPVFRAKEAPEVALSGPREAVWRAFAGGLVEVGAGPAGFAYDNERPRHTALLQPFELASRPVTAGEYLAFLEDGGYRRPELWLAEGWDHAQREDWRAPLYWEREAGAWHHMTLAGFRPVDPCEPVCHVSYYEADAYARWAGARLPSEFEWEHAAESEPVEETWGASSGFHPRPLEPGEGRARIARLFGDVWEWTSSPYAPYPGYAPYEGALGEYNGKFMIQQMVLRGGCCATPTGHVRPSYRNFYHPHQRWMFAGLRLAR